METLTSLELQRTGIIKILKFAAAVNVKFSFRFCWLAAGGGLISKQAEVSWRLFVGIVRAQTLSVSLDIQG